jgi:hypothetical protein
MGIRFLKENVASRTIGYQPKANVKIYPGNPTVLEKNAISGVIEIRPFGSGDRAAGLCPNGLAIDSNVQFPMAPTSGSPFTAGEGYDYINYNRGGLIAAVRQATVYVYDDKRDASSNPFANDAALAISKKVYVNDSGKITHDNSNAIEIGVCEDETSSGGITTSAVIRLTLV